MVPDDAYIKECRPEGHIIPFKQPQGIQGLYHPTIEN